MAVEVARLELVQSDAFIRVQRHRDALPARKTSSLSQHLAIDLLLVLHHAHVGFFCGGCLHAYVCGLTARLLIAHAAYTRNTTALAHRVAIVHKLRCLVVVVPVLCEGHVRLVSAG